MFSSSSRDEKANGKVAEKSRGKKKKKNLQRLATKERLSLFPHIVMLSGNVIVVSQWINGSKWKAEWIDCKASWRTCFTGQRTALVSAKVSLCTTAKWRKELKVKGAQKTTESSRFSFWCCKFSKNLTALGWAPIFTFIYQIKIQYECTLSFELISCNN